jgi:hypothetical protein
MIIGTYLMEEMGMRIDFQQSEMTWDGIICPLQPCDLVSNPEIEQLLYAMAVEPPILKEAEDWYNRILEADNTHINVKSHVKTMEHSS